MNVSPDDLITIIGRQTVQIIMLEAELASRDVPVIERNTLSDKDKEEIAKAFNESV